VKGIHLDILDKLPLRYREERKKFVDELQGFSFDANSTFCEEFYDGNVKVYELEQDLWSTLP